MCLAHLAIQLLEWKDVLGHVGSTLGSGAGDCILEFLKILPEEVTEGRKISLSVGAPGHNPMFCILSAVVDRSP